MWKVFCKEIIKFINEKGEIIEPVERESKAVGYSDVTELFKGFVLALKTENDSVLFEFCKKLNPDEYSKEFMERIRFNYRGIPEKIYKKGYTVDDIVVASYKTLLYFKNKLKKREHLESLEFAGLERETIGYENFGNFSTYMTETPGILRAKDKTYEYKLGELINIDGYWKCFTKSREL